MIYIMKAILMFDISVCIKVWLLLYNIFCRPEEHIDLNGAPVSNPKSPDCTAFMDLDFSMHAFEHLEVIESSYYNLRHGCLKKLN